MRWLALVALLAAPAIADLPEEPADYRQEEYNAPVPATLKGAVVLDDQAAHDLWVKGGAGFIDVLPRAPRPKNLPEGTIWRAKPHDSIPGALWLPNVGYGALAEVTHAWFRAGLEQATAGDKAAPVVIFCKADCWMSWNAARRAVEYGYVRVYWYPDGVDGWGFNGWPVERVTAMPGEP